MTDPSDIMTRIDAVLAEADAVRRQIGLAPLTEDQLAQIKADWVRRRELRAIAAPRTVDAEPAGRPAALTCPTDHAAAPGPTAWRRALTHLQSLLP